MVLDKNLYDEINEYCKLNKLKTRDFIHKILKEAFLKEKYGDSPFKMKKLTDTDTVKNVVNVVVDSLHEVLDKPEINNALENQLNDLYEEKVKDREEKVVTVEEAIEIFDNLMTTEITNVTSLPIEPPKPKKKRKLN